MRELKEIIADIDKMNGEKRVIDDKLHELYIERGKRVQYDFEQKHGLKRGDLVEQARNYLLTDCGGSFEKLAEWGLIR